MFSYRINHNLWYSSNNLTALVVRGDTQEGYALSPLKILWDFSVVCLNSPILIFTRLLPMEYAGITLAVRL
ncbi:hypothetical protein AADEFJLK_04674 [Methylovulum psychrotolerans]|uniref:Uncharacterized protein n=1 Tax=Methylovulum psychrotolerans TaxID=1704499 RepID=A0A2S5CFH2_9GAMM|nr:hypothetical protein AADEFJLK_04674 [Methylovulum psychrotolerans]